MRTSHVHNLPVVLSRQSRVSLPQQVGDELKRLILEGYFNPGAVLPSSRTLCEILQVGRSTIIEAFEQLKSEGYLVAAAGSATRVSDNIPLAVP
ncbi:MAG TPA: winged helix-turn-helix domain-containing protein, partial [Candidatus Melainabacteria bacterium]|nr:winged helix-turn-helix domain-containing protein [Candidatus Melainabacteria bacterium]